MNFYKKYLYIAAPLYDDRNFIQKNELRYVKVGASPFKMSQGPLLYAFFLPISSHFE